MKLFHTACAIASSLLALVGVFFLRKVAMFRRDVAICILTLTSAFGLNISLYIFHRRGRISDLETQIAGTKMTRRKHGGGGGARGFTLLELSIVLALIGLIVGWVLFMPGNKTAAAPVADSISLEHLNKWTPECFNYPGRGTAYHVVLLFSFMATPGNQQFAILGLSRNYATLTAPIKRFTVTSWRVDRHPFAETVSTAGDGAVFSLRRTAKLIAQMLVGKHLEVRFVESGTDSVIERSIPLDGCPQAYARYREMQECPGGASSGDIP
jgi:prepilin-type N-terminal cleavage/methylation domain-containing protein